MAEHPNVALARKGFEAFGTGDMVALTELIGENVEWHEFGLGPLSGDYTGREAVFGLFAKLAQATGNTLRIELHDVLANDEHVVALLRTRASKQGKQLDVRHVDIFHIRSGKITEFWSFSEDQRREDEFWS